MSIKCQDEICPPPYFSTYACDNTAKWLVDGRGHEGFAVCGVHARWFRKYGSNVRPIDEKEG